MPTRNLLVRAGFDASGMRSGVRQGTRYLNQFNQSATLAMSGFSSIMREIGGTLAATFAVGKLIGFGKECIELGSDLSEVQNVVDVTFGDMANQINDFAKSAITNLGLSETAAKQYSSTMGAMLKSMGLGSEDVLSMSKALTSLSADMASFYNLDADEAFAKIRSGISGETEPLKQLGINMSVANMEAYAMSQGITKAYSKMSQAEQTLLRYNYLLSVTTDAQGDFARTSDSWANQTRVLSEQFNALKATLGQSFITILTPVVKMLNTIIQRLQQAANYFNEFVQAAFGTQSNTSSAKMQAQATAAIGESAQEASDSIADMGDATEEAAQKASKSMAGFDEVNTLTKDTSSDVAGLEIGDTSADSLNLEKVPDDMSSAAQAAEEFKEGLAQIKEYAKPVIEEAKKCGEEFKEGFNLGIDTAPISKLKGELSRLSKNLKALFTDKDIVNAASKCAESWSKALGSVAGEIASIGISIATNLVGGFNRYLESSKDYIKERLVSIFTNLAGVGDSISSIAVNLADIFASAFTGENAMNLTGNIIGIFSDALLGIADVAAKVLNDLYSGIDQIISDNRLKFINALDKTFGVANQLAQTFKDAVDDTFKVFLNVYDQYIGPAIQGIIDGIDSLVGCILDFYNDTVTPVLSGMADKFDNTFKEHIQPLINEVIQVFGELAELISVVWKNILEPLLEFIITAFGPPIMQIISSIWNNACNAISAICDFIKNMLTILRGVIEFLTGVFTLDWGKAWGGLKTIFTGMWNTIKDIALGIINDIKTRIEDAIKLVKTLIDSLLEAANLKAKDKDHASLETFKQEMAGAHIEKWSDQTRRSFLDQQKTDGTWSQEIEDYVMNLPHYAKGGVITSPQIAMIGESGKEAVVPLENNTGWINDLSIKIANAINASNQVNTSSQPLNLILQLDGREAAKGLVPYLPEASRRMGVKLGV